MRNVIGDSRSFRSPLNHDRLNSLADLDDECPVVHRPHPSRAFTLIELIAVIVVLGVLSAAAIPKFFDLSKQARINTTAANLKMLFRTQLEYEQTHGPVVPIGASTIWIQGEAPEWLRDRFANDDLFARTPPYGGDYFYYTESNLNYAEIGMVETAVPPDEAIAIDRIIDDGNLSTGVFQQTTNYGYFYYHWDPTP